MKEFYDYRTVRNEFPTVLRTTASAMFDEVHGQMSDGIWENSNGYDRYWLTFENDHNGDISIIKSAYYFEPFYGKWMCNPYATKSDENIRKFFANKIKYVTKVFLDMQATTPSEKAWSRENHFVVNLGYGSFEVSTIYMVYDWLMGRYDRVKDAIANMDIDVAYYDVSTF